MELTARLVAAELLLNKQQKMEYEKVYDTVSIGKKYVPSLLSSSKQPKMYCRIIRFNASILQHQKAKTHLTDLAYTAGYFDQMHFIKEVKRFTGLSPQQFFPLLYSPLHPPFLFVAFCNEKAMSIIHRGQAGVESGHRNFWSRQSKLASKN